METLFGAMLGNFNFAVFEESAYPIFSKLIFVSYLSFMMITLLNFVIAILSSTYAKFEG
jgi:hypothetical protein